MILTDEQAAALKQRREAAAEVLRRAEGEFLAAWGFAANYFEGTFCPRCLSRVSIDTRLQGPTCMICGLNLREYSEERKP